MPSFIPYLVFGKVIDSDSNALASANLNVTTSVGNKGYTTNTNGLFLFDLAEIGYVSGEIVSMDISDKFNNKFKSHNFIVEGVSHEETITLIERTLAVGATDYSPKSIIHTVGRSPVTDENPLPVKADINIGDIEIGAVEIKDATSDTRAEVTTKGLAVFDETANSLAPAVYDYIALTYTGDNLTGVVFKIGGSGGTTVSTLTLAYTGSVLDSITQS